MSDRVYGQEEKANLERLVKEGVTVLQEIEDLQGGLKDTVKSVAEELNVKPSLINALYCVKTSPHGFINSYATKSTIFNNFLSGFLFVARELTSPLG